MKLVRYPIVATDAIVFAESPEECFDQWEELLLDWDGDIVTDINTGKRYFISIEHHRFYETLLDPSEGKGKIKNY